MTAYLINHLRIPNGVPKPEALKYLENVESSNTTAAAMFLGSVCVLLTMRAARAILDAE